MNYAYNLPGPTTNLDGQGRIQEDDNTSYLGSPPIAKGMDNDCFTGMKDTHYCLTWIPPWGFPPVAEYQKAVVIALHI